MATAADLKNEFITGAIATQQMFYDLIDNCTNDVSTESSNTGISGIVMNMISSGNVYNFWPQGSATANISVPTTGVALAQPTDFACLAGYTGGSVSVPAIEYDSTGAFVQEHILFVSSNGIFIFPNNTSGSTISSGNKLSSVIALIL